MRVHDTKHIIYKLLCLAAIIALCAGCATVNPNQMEQSGGVLLSPRPDIETQGAENSFGQLQGQDVEPCAGHHRS